MALLKLSKSKMCPVTCIPSINSYKCMYDFLLLLLFFDFFFLNSKLHVHVYLQLADWYSSICYIPSRA